MKTAKTERISYSVQPPQPFEWIDSGERIVIENRGIPVQIVVWDAGSPCCSEHGLMAQGFDYWYCEACENS